MLDVATTIALVADTQTSSEHLRAGDADRQRVAGQLQAAHDDCRLTLEEYDERLGAAYRARTFGELISVVSDLPLPSPAAPASSPKRSRARRLARSWGVGATMFTVLCAIGATGYSSHDQGDYWRIWAYLIVLSAGLTMFIASRPRSRKRGGH